MTPEMERINAAIERLNEATRAQYPCVNFWVWVARLFGMGAV